MIHIDTLEKGLDLFKALGSEIRIEIINLLLKNKSMNMNELATELNITNGALTSHIKKLEECGIISIENESTGHGNQKICSVTLDKLVVDFKLTDERNDMYDTEVKIGHYSDYLISPTCGIATNSNIIGEVDDPRSFSNPNRIFGDILWFTKGYVEYIIPNFVPVSHKIQELSISLELCSEAPGYNNNWPSDIHFYINNTYLGMWTSPGDFGDVKGVFTPDWWYSSWNQYGILKTIVVNQEGTFIDGNKISNITMNDLNLDYRSTIKFKLSIPEDATNIGGLTIFGKGFGNYDQNINIRVKHHPTYL